MKQSLIKKHLIIFEIFSILVTIFILVNVCYYVLFYRLNSGLESENQSIALIKFNFTEDRKISSDITIKLKSLELMDKNLSTITNDNEGYLILNKKMIEKYNKKGKNIKEKLKNINDCFIFRDKLTINSAQGVIIDLKIFSSDIWNTSIYLFIVIYIAFLKYNMCRLNYYTIKNFNKFPYFSIFQRRYAFSYIILNFTIIFILPYLFKLFSDMTFDNCFGFKYNFFNSYFLDRTFLSDEQKNSLNFYSYFHYGHKNDTQSGQKDQFFLHAPYLFKEVVGSYTYEIGILFACLIVWISSIFVRNSLEIYYDHYDEEEESREKLSPLRKIFNSIWSGALIIVWSCFLFFGILSNLDIFILFNQMIFHYFIRILDIRILIFIFLSYSQIYLYFFIVFVSINSEIKKRKVKRQYFRGDFSKNSLQHYEIESNDYF